MPWFQDNAPPQVKRPGVGMADPNVTPLVPADYVPPTGGINPDGMYSGTEPIPASAINPLPTGPMRQMQATPGTSGPSTPAPTGGTWDEGTFTSQFGRPGTPQDLIALEPKLAAQGIKVLRNASGVAGKIQLPNGQIVDVINAAGLGGRGFQWDAGPGGGGQTLGNFQTGTFTGGGQYPLASVMGTGLAQPWTTPFNAPNDVTQQNDPGWQFRMREGLKAIERSAASKGTLLTGGTLKNLAGWAQDTASNEYDKVYGRALGEYQQAYGIYNNNQNNLYNRLSGISGQGLNAGQTAAQMGTGYGLNSAANAQGGADATAAGQAAGGAAWANAAGQLGNIASGTLYSWPYYNTRTSNTYNPGFYDPNSPLYGTGQLLYR